MQQLNVVLFVYWIIYIFQPLQTIHYTRLELSAFQIFLISLVEMESPLLLVDLTCIVKIFNNS